MMSPAVAAPGASISGRGRRACKAGPIAQSCKKKEAEPDQGGAHGPQMVRGGSDRLLSILTSGVWTAGLVRHDGGRRFPVAAKATTETPRPRKGLLSRPSRAHFFRSGAAQKPQNLSHATGRPQDHPDFRRIFAACSKSPRQSFLRMNKYISYAIDSWIPAEGRHMTWTI